MGLLQHQEEVNQEVLHQNKICQLHQTKIYMPKKVNLVGQVFSQLTVMAKAIFQIYGDVRWICECSCGGVSVVTSNNLIKNHSKSCGCLVSKTCGERFTKHGLSSGGYRRPMYKLWKSMKARCYNKNDTNYRHYGGRGISMCERWLESPLNLIEDMGERPSPNHSVDRINNDGNYEPSNCRWATADQQQSNKRSNKVLTYMGKKYTITQFSQAYGIGRWRVANIVNNSLHCDYHIHELVSKNSSIKFSFGVIS